MFVHDFTRFKVVEFVKKSDTTVALLTCITDYIIPHKLSIKCDGIMESSREIFNLSWIAAASRYEHTLLDTLQYSGGAERALGLFTREWRRSDGGVRSRHQRTMRTLWTQAMLFACDVINKSDVMSTGGTYDL